MSTGQKDKECRALWVMRVAGTAVVVLAVVLLIVLPAEPVSENVPGFFSAVVGFELASRPDHVSSILGELGSPERAEAARRMDLGTRIDFLYALAYAAFYVGITLLLAARTRISRGVQVMLYALAAVMVLGDWLENRELLVLCWMTDGQEIAEALPRLRFLTLVKWYAIYAASAIVATAIWREVGWWRWSAIFFALAAALGFSSLIYLPAIEYGGFALVVAWIATYVRALG